ncbi:GtrA family protein [Weissella confusa]|uniref:GtrA family protein n=1 Tax=Weissella fermenti TaxID=2987699 RepID=A0ABT6D658_9LACO|nr:GtrA family protein [Weissella sp. BK2]MBJ7689323.1 GtrA family protein [Weissella confusa]MDF9301011.1 GtrA family protein [Weissella sp. BK2]
MYVAFGILTTVINVASYTVMISINWNVQVAVVISWITAVAVAYITNCKWVFNSQVITAFEILREIFSFFMARLATLILEMVIIWFGVQLLKQNAIVWKVVDNFVVIIVNYAISKMIIFKATR